MTFGERIKKRRLDKGLTQKDLADMVGVGQTTIARYESNTNFPTKFVLAAIAEKLDVDTFWLILGDKRGMIDEKIIPFLSNFKATQLTKEGYEKDGTLRTPKIIKELANLEQDKKLNIDVDKSEIFNNQADLEKESVELKEIIANQKEKILELQNKLIELLEKDSK